MKISQHNNGNRNRCVDIKFPKDGERFLKEFAIDSNVCNVWSVIVIQAVDILHDASAVSLDGCQETPVFARYFPRPAWNKSHRPGDLLRVPVAPHPPVSDAGTGEFRPA